MHYRRWATLCLPLLTCLCLTPAFAAAVILDALIEMTRIRRSKVTAR